MNRYINFICALTLLTSPVYAVSLKKISSLFKSQPEDVVQREYPMPENGMLTVENINGTITIKAEWTNNMVVVRTLKQTSDSELLPKIRILADQNNPKHLIIRTDLAQEKMSATVHYEIAVPSSISLTIKNKKGAISIENIRWHRTRSH